MLEVPLFFRDELKNKVIETLSQSENLDDIIIDFLEKYNLFSLDPKICKISKLASPKENFSIALKRGVTLNQFSYPNDNIYELEIPIPIFTPLMRDSSFGFTNSPAYLYKSRSVSEFDLNSESLCELSEMMGNTPIFYNHILMTRGGQKKQKLFFYIEQGSIEYSQYS